MAGRMDFEFNLGRDIGPAPARRRDGPFRILVVGDFSGRDAQAPGEQRPIAVDIDNFDTVMAGLAPRVTLPLGDDADAAIEIASLDAFHPDSLFDSLAPFHGLRELRRRLMDSATYEAAAAELRHGLPEPGAAEKPAAPDGNGDGETLFEHLIGGRPPEAPAQDQSGSSDAIAPFLRRLVAPYIVQSVAPEQAQLVSSVDAAIGDQMRDVLREPAFQAMEARWRSLWGLVTGLELDEALTLHLLDLPRAALDAALGGEGALEDSFLWRLLVEPAGLDPDNQGWALIVGDYAFGMGEDDVAVLARLGGIAAGVGGPFLAAAAAEIMGPSSLAAEPDHRGWTPEPNGDERWRLLRKAPVAPWLGLAASRILLRLPYGARTEPVDRFEFEEASGGFDHAAYLWGNPAFACARLIGEAYQQAGWNMTPGDVGEIGELPAHIYESGGEQRMMACSELFLTEGAAERMLARGVMPAISFRNRNAVRILRFQSLADPAVALSGPWA